MNRLRPAARFPSFPLAIALAALFLPTPPQLRADMPERRMANLFIQDQGNHLIASFHYYYYLLPPQFVLEGKTISLQDTSPDLLTQNLTEIAHRAFELKIDGQVVEPKILQLTPYPNKSCLMVLSYPGHAGSHAELRAPIFAEFPPGYMINVNITSSTGTKGAYFGKVFPPVVGFVQGKDIVLTPAAPPLFSPAFRAELGIAWVNYNWILTCALLLFLQRPRQLMVLIGAMIIGWILLCFASVAFDWKPPHKIPELVLAVPAVLLCLTDRAHRGAGILTALVTVWAGLLNAAYDLQLIPLAHPDQAAHALAGLFIGFAGGIVLVLVALVPIWWECNKQPGFRESWSPKIAWVLAGLALFLPLQKMMFG